uniref:Uncharacterized protein n=1 Tax=Triticum urartu TaxID=4572 RepID=A0A8R7TKW1_TRIUA
MSDGQGLGVLGRPEREDEPREDVVGVVHVRVPLHDERVAALVADGVQRLAFPDHVHLVARPRRRAAEPRAAEVRRGAFPVAVRGLRAERAQQHERDERHRAPPRRRVRGRHGGGAQLRAPEADRRRGHAIEGAHGPRERVRLR